jgi:DNA-binding NarL/FixJ family response regulator
VILVDLNIPDRDGVELLETLHVQLPCAKLLVLSAYQDAHRVQEALQAGADGYLVKTTPLDQTLAAIRSIAGGGSPFSSSITRFVVDIMRRGAQPGDDIGLGGLSKRELQVFRLLAEGLKTRETAARLTISHKTVETHRIRIYKKLQVNTPAELTRIAVRAGLLEP